VDSGTTNSPDGRTDSDDDAGLDMPNDDAGTDNPSYDAGPNASQCDTATHLCVPTIPTSWTGPVIYAETSTGDDDVTCPAGYSNPMTRAYTGLDEGSASCTCQCGDPQGVTCGNATLRGYGNSSCVTDGGFGLPPASVASCQQSIPDSNYYRFTAPSVSGGSCAPINKENITTASWSTRTSACQLTDGLDACGADTSCAPRPPAEFESALCIVRSGDHSCPAGAFSKRFVRHTGLSDTRTCKGCTCGAPSGSCGGTMRIKHNASGTCSGGSTDAVLSPGTCGYAPNGEQASYTPNPSSASCSTTSSSSLTGSVTPTGSTTYCCMTL
jgi:hypothetical protein